MTSKKSIQDIIGEIPEGLNEIEKIRYIYIKLGKYFIYNINFFINEEHKQQKMYNKKIDIQNIYTRKQICSQIAYALSSAINQMVEGVSASTMVRIMDKRIINGELRKIEHIATKVETENGEKYILDLTKDLYRIQNNLQTKEFGFASYVDDDYDIISLREAREMDNKIGYTFHGIYMNEFLKQMKDEMVDEKLIKEYVIGNKCEGINKDTILQYKMDFILKNLDLRDNGPIEAKDFVLYALESILTEDEKKRVKQFNLYKKDSHPKMDVAIRLKCGEDSIYYLRKDEGNFQKVKLDDICKLMQNDWFMNSRTMVNETRNEGYTL